MHCVFKTVWNASESTSFRHAKQFYKFSLGDKGSREYSIEKLETSWDVLQTKHLIDSNIFWF